MNEYIFESQQNKTQSNCLKERIIYMSPEYRSCLKLKEDFNYEKSDIFSLGLNLLRIT